ncbi:hypothetical protein [Deinococcus sp. QL22]|jgi:hypothetical protein|uniref:hypothetical protein n=1 Tax=Deinococcus sp. QL22 TaxID=2939437 RepID=UPI0020176F16|nr:hypothetical protein [Deinococcus sp. QL22]UQN07408.1 hypothetical protein M1R55_05800 [Deinococcus sp. QL22]
MTIPSIHAEPLTRSPRTTNGRQRTTLTPQQLDTLTVLDVVETAALLRIGQDLVRKEIRAGRLIAENYGTPSRPIYRIYRPQLDAWRAVRSTAAGAK